MYSSYVIIEDSVSSEELSDSTEGIHNKQSITVKITAVRVVFDRSIEAQDYYITTTHNQQIYWSSAGLSTQEPTCNYLCIRQEGESFTVIPSLDENTSVLYPVQTLKIRENDIFLLGKTYVAIDELQPDRIKLLYYDIDNPNEIQSQSLTTSSCLGRARSNTVRLDDSLCSRTHARIYQHFNCWYIRNESMKNGTFAEISAPITLPNNSELIFNGIVYNITISLG